MGKWFMSGLSKEELRKKYELLARKYNPSLNPAEGSVQTMREINAEYDLYACFSDGTTKFGSRLTNRGIKDDSNQFLMWVIRDRELERTGLIPHDTKAFVGRVNLFDSQYTYGGWGDAWQATTSGLHVVEIVSEYTPTSQYMTTVAPVNRDIITVPSEDDLVQMIYEQFICLNRKSFPLLKSKTSSCNMDRFYTPVKIHIINSKDYGRICYLTGVSPYEDGVTVLAKFGDRIHFAIAQEEWFGEYELEQEVGVYELYVRHYYKDIGIFSLRARMGDTRLSTHAYKFQARPVGQGFFPSTDNPIVSQWFRVGILQIYQAQKSPQQIFGFINCDRFMIHLPDITLEDLSVVQDYLREINEAFDKWAEKAPYNLY